MTQKQYISLLARTRSLRYLFEETIRKEKDYKEQSRLSHLVDRIQLVEDIIKETKTIN